MQARGQKGCFVPFVSFFLYGTARSKGQVTCNAGGGIFLLLRSTAKKPLPSYGPERASGREWGKVRNRKCWVKRRGKCPSQGSSSGGTWATNIAVQTNMEDPVGCSESLQSPAGCQSAVDCLCTKSMWEGQLPLWGLLRQACVWSSLKDHAEVGPGAEFLRSDLWSTRITYWQCKRWTGWRGFTVMRGPAGG